MYYDPKEAANYLSYSPAALERWRADGIGPRFCRVLGRVIRYKRTDLDAWMRTFVVNTDDQPAPQPRVRLTE